MLKFPFRGAQDGGVGWVAQRWLARFGRELDDRVAYTDGPAVGNFGELAQRTKVADDGFAALGPLQTVAAGARLGDLDDGLVAELKPVAGLQLQERQALNDELFAKLPRRGAIALGGERLEPLIGEQVELAIGVAPGFLVAVDTLPGDQAGTLQREAQIVLPILAIGHADWLVNDTGNLRHLNTPILDFCTCPWHRCDPPDFTTRSSATLR
ncbi:MAG: hypothetical protein P8X95_03395 [Anaerolineales bacterium]